MPQREVSFTVSATPEELWRFIRNFEALCTCIPGVERIVVVDERTVELTVREKIGIVPMIIDLRAKIDSEDPPRSLRATARADHLTMAIDVTLQPNAAGTELLTRFDVTGEGQLKSIVDQLFERKATERAAQFAQSLQQRFGVEPVAKPPEEVRAGWLVRLWRRLLKWIGP